MGVLGKVLDILLTTCTFFDWDQAQAMVNNWIPLGYFDRWRQDRYEDTFLVELPRIEDEGCPHLGERRLALSLEMSDIRRRCVSRG